VAVGGVAREGGARVTGRSLRSVVPFLVACVLASAIVGGLAVAGPADTDDPRDTKGLLDVRTMRVRHPKGQPPEWTFLTFRSWTVRQLWDRGYAVVYFDTVGGEPAEYMALIRSDGHQMLGSLWRLAKGTGKDRLLSGLSVRRKSKDGVSIKVPLKKMHYGDQRSFYRWWAVTVFTSDKCPSYCIDRIPDTGSVLRYRPGMSPSPPSSPSPSP
jgi:hypothetical protein